MIAERLAEEYLDLQDSIKLYEKRLEEIKKLFKETYTGHNQVGQYTIDVEDRTMTTVDRKLLEKVYGPEVASQFLRTTNYKAVYVKELN